MSADRVDRASAATDAPLSTFARWRQRLAGGLFVLGGAGSVLAVFLPWLHAEDLHQTLAPSVVLTNALAGAGIKPPFLLLWLLVEIVLPLSLLVFGARLLVRAQPVRLRWKVLALVGGIIAFCTMIFYVTGLSLTYLDSASTVHGEIGEILAQWATLGMLSAGIVMPKERHLAT